MAESSSSVVRKPSAVVQWDSEFNEFVTAHCKLVQDHLVTEMNRITMTRELHWKKELQASRNINQELQSKLKILEKHGSPAALHIGEDEAEVLDSMGDKDEVPCEEAQISVVISEGMDVNSCIVSIDDHSQNEHLQTKSARFEKWPEWQAETLTHFDSARDFANIQENLYEQDEIVDWHSGIPRSAVQEKVRCTAEPHSPLALCWQLLSIPVLFYDLAMIPLTVFIEKTSSFFTWLGWVITLYWTADLFLHMFVIGYVSKSGEVQLRRRLIIKHYMKTSFMFDIILVIPDWLAMIVGPGLRNVSALRTFRLIRLMRLFRMARLRHMIREIYDFIDSEYLAIYVSITANLLICIGCCHYLGCFWFFIGSTKVDGYRSWVEYYEMDDKEWRYQYVTSLFWAITQFTPGSFRVQPCNIPETLVAFAVLIFGMVFFSMFISSMTNQRVKLQNLSSKIDRDILVLRRYLRQNRLSRDLVMRCVHFAEVAVAPKLEAVQRRDVFLLPYLSEPLQLEVQAEIAFKTLLAHPFLQWLRGIRPAWTSVFFPHFVLDISLADTDMLFEAGQVSHEMYFVARGKLAYHQRGSHELQLVPKSSWCCEPVIWVPWVHQGTAKAAEECHLISIDSAKMREAVLEHTERSLMSVFAEGYMHDLNAYVDAGIIIGDTIQISDDESTKYGMLCKQVSIQNRTQDLAWLTSYYKK